MVSEEVTVQDAPELPDRETCSELRPTTAKRRRGRLVAARNLKGPWQLIRRAFAGEDAERGQGRGPSARKVREVRFQKGNDPLVYRFEIWELRIEEAEEAASAKPGR